MQPGPRGGLLVVVRIILYRSFCQRPRGVDFIQLRFIIPRSMTMRPRLCARCALYSSRRSGSWPFRLASRESPSPSRSRSARPSAQPAPAPPSEPLRERDPTRGAGGRDGRSFQGPGIHGTIRVWRGRRGIPRSSPPCARLDSRRDQPGDRLLERQRRQGRAGEESRG